MITSNCRTGRAPHGFAGYLADLQEVIGESADPRELGAVNGSTLLGG